MKTITAPTPYGYQELRLLHQRYMALAMLVAVTFQMTLVGGYHFAEWLKPVANIVKETPRDTIEIDIWNPPTNDPTKDFTYTPILEKFGIGAPVPVPDAVVDTSTEYASQKQLSDEANRIFAQYSGKIGDGTIIIPPDPNDNAHREIWQVEVCPRPILSPKPEYPVLAQKINLEGSATIKVLLDKEGRIVINQK